MITFFTTLKPHRGHTAIIQRNALQSWLASVPGCRVLLMGDEPGTAELARALDIQHVADIARNEYGTPLLNSLFAQAEGLSETRLMCYINADILLMSNFAAALGEVLRRKRRFLLVGRRWDCDVTDPLDFTDDWEVQLHQRVRAAGRLQPPTMIDYFVYPRGMWGRLPPFAIGRTVWDNWLIYRARCLRVLVIDATEQVTVVHQNHDYTHATSDHGPESRTTSQKRGYNWIWRGPEARRNFAIANGKHNLYTIWDTTHRLTPQGLTLRRTVGLGGGIWSYRRSARVGF